MIDRLAAALQAEFPGRQGFSPSNLKYMRAFAEAWPGGVFVQATLAQMGGNPIVQQAAAQLPWMHHCLLHDRLKTPEDRLWYAAKAVEYGWPRNILRLRDQAGRNPSENPQRLSPQHPRNRERPFRHTRGEEKAHPQTRPAQTKILNIRDRLHS